MKVLVTGAAGGLGQLIITELLAAGHAVVATSRNPEKAKELPFYRQVTYLPYDINTTDHPNLFSYFQEPDTAIHLAWEKLNAYKDADHVDEILPKHCAFLHNLLMNGLKDLTCVGTCYEYGIQEGELREDMASLPVMPYPQAKNDLRVYLETLQKSLHFHLKWPRVFYVFGPIKERKNLYTLLMDAVARGDESFNMSGGEQTRDFMSPDEIAATLVKIALQTKVEGIINCCSGKAVKLRDKVEGFLAEHQYTLRLNFGHYPYPDYEPMHTWGSVKKLQGIG